MEPITVDLLSYDKSKDGIKEYYMGSLTKQQLSLDDSVRQSLTSRTSQQNYRTSSSVDTVTDSSWTGDAWAHSFQLAELDYQLWQPNE